MSNDHIRIKDTEDESDRDYEKKMIKKNKIFSEKFSPKNNAMRFTLYTDRKGIVDTENYLPTISQSQKYATEGTDPNNHNTFGTNLKGGINFAKDLGRKKV